MYWLRMSDFTCCFQFPGSNFQYSLFFVLLWLAFFTVKAFSVDFCIYFYVFIGRSTFLVTGFRFLGNALRVCALDDVRMAMVMRRREGRSAACHMTTHNLINVKRL